MRCHLRVKTFGLSAAARNALRYPHGRPVAVERHLLALRQRLQSEASAQWTSSAASATAREVDDQRFNGARHIPAGSPPPVGDRDLGSGRQADAIPHGDSRHDAGRWGRRPDGARPQPRGSAQRGPQTAFQGPPDWVALRQQREGDARLRGLRDGWRGDALYGINPVMGALTARRRQLHGLYVQEGLGSKAPAPEVQRIIKMAAEAGVPMHRVAKHDLNVLTDNSAHQGLLLECSPLEFVPLDDLGDAAEQPGGRSCVWLALDEVTDPHNLGAVLRSASFLGVAGVLTCARNSSPLTPAVSKVSAGAAEHLRVHSCRAMQKTLQLAAESGWDVLGAANDPGSTPCARIDAVGPTVLVLGSERRGLRTTVRRACTRLVRVDGGTDVAAAGLDSLNVSVAAGILLHQLLAHARAA